MSCRVNCPVLDELENAIADTPINQIRPEIELFEMLKNSYHPVGNIIEVTTRGHCWRSTDKEYRLTVDISCKIANLKGMHIPFELKTSHDFLADLAAKHNSINL